MPRNSSGTYSLPQSPFQSNTTILSASVNSNFSDIAVALTQSLATSGVSTMTGQLLAANGSASGPSISFGASATTGLYSGAANQFNLAANGLLIATVSTSGIQINSGSFLDSTGAKIGVPVGVVIDYAGATAPALWLLCYGQAVSRTTYSVLFTAIGTTWGIGDGSTTFNIPDFRGRAIYGKDNMGGSAANRITTAGGNYDGTVLGNTGGAQNHTLTTAQLPVHTPSGSVSVGGSQSFTGVVTQTAPLNRDDLTNVGQSVFNSNTTVTVNGSNFSATFTGNSIGSGNSHSTLDPSAICNKIIYAGV